jgi:hypothetical protein
MGTSDALQDENTAYYVSEKHPVVKAAVVDGWKNNLKTSNQCLDGGR